MHNASYNSLALLLEMCANVDQLVNCALHLLFTKTAALQHSHGSHFCGLTKFLDWKMPSHFSSSSPSGNPGNSTKTK